MTRPDNLEHLINLLAVLEVTPLAHARANFVEALNRLQALPSLVSVNVDPIKRLAYFANAAGCEHSYFELGQFWAQHGRYEDAGIAFDQVPRASIHYNQANYRAFLSRLATVYGRRKPTLCINDVLTESQQDDINAAIGNIFKIDDVSTQVGLLVQLRQYLGLARILQLVESLGHEVPSGFLAVHEKREFEETFDVYSDPAPDAVVKRAKRFNPKRAPDSTPTPTLEPSSSDDDDNSTQVTQPQNKRSRTQKR